MCWSNFISMRLTVSFIDRPEFGWTSCLMASIFVLITHSTAPKNAVRIVMTTGMSSMELNQSGSVTVYTNLSRIVTMPPAPSNPRDGGVLRRIETLSMYASARSPVVWSSHCTVEAARSSCLSTE